MATQAAQPAPTPQSIDLRVDAALAVGVFAASLGLLAAGADDPGARGGGVDALGVVLTALASLPLVARRLAPLAVFVGTGLASAALFGLVGPAGPPIGPTVALYGVGAADGESRARPLLTGAVVATVFLVHLTATGLGEGAFPGTESLFGVVVWGGAWLVGERTRLRRQRMAELEERALRAQHEAERERRLAAAEERMRIAHDLHDSAGHAINVILVHAGHGRLATERDPAGAREAFETIEEVARETVGEIDQLVSALRDGDPLSEGSNGPEPPPGLAALDGLVARHRAAGLDVTVTVRGSRHPLPPAVERGAYRILQEALTNAARHGDGSAQIELAYGAGALEVSVVNPLSRDHAGQTAGGGHGVIGMRERAALLGGSLEAGAGNGSFRVHARLPLFEDPA